MKAYISTLKFGFKQISRDFMLILMIFAPFLCGIVFKFFLPILDGFIADTFKVDKVLLPYYRIFDTLLVYLTPTLICIISSFIILEELDDEVSKYIFVTPVGYTGYIFARLIIPSIFAFCLAWVALLLFQLTEISVILSAVLALLATLYAFATTLAVVSIAKNKVEGLALTKLTGVTFAGIMVPYFIDGNAQYIFAVLPSYWMSKVSLDYGSGYFLSSMMIGIACTATWIWIFYGVFKRKVS